MECLYIFIVFLSVWIWGLRVYLFQPDCLSNKHDNSMNYYWWVWNPCGIGDDAEILCYWQSCGYDLTLYMLNNFEKTQKDISICIIHQWWDGAGRWNCFSWKTRTPLIHQVNILSSEDLVMQGIRLSTLICSSPPVAPFTIALNLPVR